MNSGSIPSSIPAIDRALRFSLNALRQHFVLLLAAFYGVSGGSVFYVWHLTGLWPSVIILVLVHFILLGGWLNIALKLYDGQQLRFGLLFSKVNQFWKFLCIGALSNLVVLVAIPTTLIVIAASAVILAMVLNLCNVGFLAPYLVIVLLGIPYVVAIIYLAVRFCFCNVAIADQDCGPIAALRYSWQITKGRVFKTTAFLSAILSVVAVVTLPSILIAVTCGVLGYDAFVEFWWRLFKWVAIPLVMVFFALSQVHCYKQLVAAGSNVGASLSITEMLEDIGAFAGGATALVSSIACVGLPYLFIGLAFCFAIQNSTNPMILRCYDLAIRLDPNSLIGYGLRGAAYSDSRKYSNAISDLSKQLEIKAQAGLWAYRARMLEQRGSAYHHLGQAEKAISDWQEALRLSNLEISEHPNDPSPSDYAGRSGTYYFLGEYDKAVEDAKVAAQLEPNNGSYFNSLGWLSALAGTSRAQYLQALEACNTAIRLDNSAPNYYDSRAYAYAKLGLYQQAADDTKTALSIGAQRVFYDWDDTIEYLQKDAYTYALRGLVYHELGQYDRAVAFYRKALELDPNCAAATYFLAAIDHTHI